MVHSGRRLPNTGDLAKTLRQTADRLAFQNEGVKPQSGRGNSGGTSGRRTATAVMAIGVLDVALVAGLLYAVILLYVVIDPTLWSGAIAIRGAKAWKITSVALQVPLWVRGRGFWRRLTAFAVASVCGLLVLEAASIVPLYVLGIGYERLAFLIADANVLLSCVVAFAVGWVILRGRKADEAVGRLSTAVAEGPNACKPATVQVAADVQDSITDRIRKIDQGAESGALSREELHEAIQALPDEQATALRRKYNIERY